MYSFVANDFTFNKLTIIIKANVTLGIFYNHVPNLHTKKLW